MHKLTCRNTSNIVGEEVVVDVETGDVLPEELNDGELEGGDHYTSWNYLNQDLWPIEYPLCRGLNMRQSPIDIITSLVQVRPLFGIEFIDYDQQVEFILRNTRHSISLTPVPLLAIPAIRLSWLDGENVFELQEIHLHWGDDILKGSEHRLDGFQGAAEMHFVHYRRGIDKKDLGIIPNSVVVLAVIIEPGMVDFNKLEIIVRGAANINGTNVEYVIEQPLLLTDLLPVNYQAFFTYEGSLTTPPCYEVVTWVVLRQPVFILRDLLYDLINLEALDLDMNRFRIRANYRQVQPLLDRPVYASFNVAVVDEPPPPVVIDTPATRALQRIRAARDRLRARMPL